MFAILAYALQGEHGGTQLVFGWYSCIVGYGLQSGVDHFFLLIENSKVKFVSPREKPDSQIWFLSANRRA